MTCPSIIQFIFAYHSHDGGDSDVIVAHGTRVARLQPRQRYQFVSLCKVRAGVSLPQNRSHPMGHSSVPATQSGMARAAISDFPFRNGNAFTKAFHTLPASAACILVACSNAGRFLATSGNVSAAAAQREDSVLRTGRCPRQAAATEDRISAGQSCLAGLQTRSPSCTISFDLCAVLLKHIQVTRSDLSNSGACLDSGYCIEALRQPPLQIVNHLDDRYCKLWKYSSLWNKKFG